MAKKPIWIIAHKCNSPSDVADALGDGANAIECDVRLHHTGFVVSHDRISEHPLRKPVVIPKLAPYLKYIVKSKKKIALLYIDYKGPDFSKKTAAKLVKALTKAGLPASGIRVIVSTAKYKNRGMFGGVPKAPWIAPQIDEAAPPDAVAKYFKSKGFTHCWYGDGIDAILPEPPRVELCIRSAVALRNKGSVIRGVVIWTLDRQMSMKRYLNIGVNAILTNDPDDLVAVLGSAQGKKAFRKATRADPPW